MIVSIQVSNDIDLRYPGEQILDIIFVKLKSTYCHLSQCLDITILVILSG